MNFKTLVYSIDQSCKKGHWNEARTLIEGNISQLITPEKRALLSADARNFLKIVLEDRNKKTEEEGPLDAEDPIASHKRQKQKLEDEKEVRQNIAIVKKINEYCDDLNFRRARKMIEDNLDLLAIEGYRKKVSRDALALVESIEHANKK